MIERESGGLEGELADRNDFDGNQLIVIEPAAFIHSSVGSERHLGIRLVGRIAIVISTHPSPSLSNTSKTAAGSSFDTSSSGCDILKID